MVCLTKTVLKVCFVCLVCAFEKVNAYFNEGLNPVHFDHDWLQRNTRVAINSDSTLNCERPDFYICEEPEIVVPPESTKICNYRNVRYQEQVYRWVAGRGCLQFTPGFLYKDGDNPFNLNSGCYYGHLFAPCLELEKEDGTCACYPFDPGLEEVARAVRDAMIPAAESRWERCFYAASDCCSHIMSQNYSYLGEFYCPATFDAWTCWEAAPGDTTPTEVCPEFAYSNSGPTCQHFSSKSCFANGTWALQTDYSTCSITPRLLRRYHYHIGMLAFSIVSCLPAVFVFFFYKRLRVTRVSLHRNLLIAIICRNVLVIISRSVIYIDELTSGDETVMSRHSVWCRVLSVSERIVANAVFVCMLVEGIYLHRLIVAVFKKKVNVGMLYGIGFVIAIVPVIAWAIVMGMHNDHSCWLIYTIDHIQWILDAPRLCILLVNTGLFLDVLRVLLTKIRNSENANQLSTTKATLFLMPIFGTQFLLTAFRPNTNNCNGEEAYYYITYTVEGLQGFIVAMLYCYVNKEVHMLVKATYRKTENAVVSRVRRDSNYRRATLGLRSDRRMTFSTGLDPNEMDEIEKDSYVDVSIQTRPKLHVAEIVSIQASERLAEILDPVYEVIENGFTNSGYDSYGSRDPAFSRRPVVDDYSKTSSVADGRDWIRCISSPTSSVYENSLNDYEVNYLERKFPRRAKRLDNVPPKLKDAQVNTDSVNDDGNNYLDMSFQPKKSNNDDNEEYEPTDFEASEENTIRIKDNAIKVDIHNEDVSTLATTVGTSKNDDDCVSESSESMVDEILQYFGNVVLDPDVLSPNREEEDKIMFIE